MKRIPKIRLHTIYDYPEITYSKLVTTPTTINCTTTFVKLIFKKSIDCYLSGETGFSTLQAFCVDSGVEYTRPIDTDKLIINTIETLRYKIESEKNK